MFPWFGLRLTAEFDVLIELWQMALTDGTNSSDEEETFLPKRRISRPNGQQLLRFSFFLPIQSARTGSAAGLVGRNKRVLCVFCAAGDKTEKPPKRRAAQTNGVHFFDIQIRQDFTCHTRCQFVMVCRGPVQLNNRAAEQRSSLVQGLFCSSLPNKV